MKKNKKQMKANYNRREFLKLAGAGASTFILGSFLNCQTTPPKKLPNIIIILTDDQGYADISSYNAKGIQTPNLNRMAEEGIRFTDFYVASSVCSPSRAALLTGCYPQRVGIPDVLAPPGPPWTEGRTNIGLNNSETTIAEMLKPLGYTTACFGKWHLGHLPEFLPTRHGFDEYFGLPYSNDMIPEDYPPLPLMEGEKIIQYNPDQSQLTTWYTERAIKFIEKNKDHPFFLYVPHSMPHIPIAVSDKFKGKSGQGLYGDVIMEIDWSVGEILKKMAQLKLEDNTLVIFFSDNGPWLEYGNHAGSALPLREGKMTTFEGGQRVPCIMRWSGKIPAGSVCCEMATSMDILPTISAITGAALPAVKIDGKDARSLWGGKPDAKTLYEAVYFYYGNELQGIRSGKWKLYLPHTYQTPVIIGKDGERGKMEEVKLPLSLYDLEQDISEKNNVAEQYPEIVERLTQMAKAFDTDLKQNLRPVGRVENY
ncbi:MAG: sulfatase [Calditrichaceae bacterium]|nr:sulfatase [Calditrichaceae bacterium]MBN2708075.1 sulfatase [Calditrichaceae bacterium]RQV92494.1 MAG: arylsulfatase [Calditrichota bacterium]